MGFSSGTDLALPIIHALHSEGVDPRVRGKVYTTLITALEDLDWDTQNEALGLDPEFDRAMKQLHPDWGINSMQDTFKNKIVVITGTLNVPRGEFVALIKGAGGIVAGNVTEGTDIVIEGANPGQKLTNAIQLGIPIWDEVKARAVMAGQSGGLFEQKVYGASDDLVELEGCVREELAGGDEPTYVRFTNGTYLKIVYGPEGIWRIEVLAAGRGKLQKLFGMPDDEDNPQAHHDKDAPIYSDVLIIRSEEEIKLESWGRKPLKEASPGRAKAQKIVAALDAGFDRWWCNVEEDDKNGILDAIAKIIES